MDLATVHDVHMAINLVHRFVYFTPEGNEEYGRLGLEGRGCYFGSRAAPLGPVPAAVVLATFYNFSPVAVNSAMPGVWDTASPEALQAARFRAVARAIDRVGGRLSDADIAAARAVIDPVVAGLDHAGKPLAAANAALALPDDPMVALWQQVTVIREWRGDAHIAVLQANRVGPCDCMVLQVGTGRFPLGVTQATRQWSEAEWAGAIARLGSRGWVDAAGAVTDLGRAERERIERETDELCAPMWEAVSEADVRRLTALITPIHKAMEAAGTYAALS